VVTFSPFIIFSSTASVPSLYGTASGRAEAGSVLAAAAGGPPAEEAAGPPSSRRRPAGRERVEDPVS
jgi:hypothetical protein